MLFADDISLVCEAWEDIHESHGLTIKTGIRMLLCYVFPKLRYGAESQMLTHYPAKKQETIEMGLAFKYLKYLEQILICSEE